MIRTMPEFTDLHRDILDFERTLWKYAGAKEAAIREKFDISATRYYQLLAWAIEQPAALEHAPMTVRRLQRLRDKRLAARRRGRPYGLAG